uniref:Uncharacterized protein n=1 Tax=Oryza glumipatula TaxID=40148 RepID=A0A0D9Y8Z2_9ORYZ
MAATYGGLRMRGIGSAPWWQMCNAVKTGETIGMRMWDVGWASHVRALIGGQEWRRRRPGSSALPSVRSGRRGGGNGALHLPDQEGEQTTGADAPAHSPFHSIQREGRLVPPPLHRVTTTSAASCGNSGGGGAAGGDAVLLLSIRR